MAKANKVIYQGVQSLDAIDQQIARQNIGAIGDAPIDGKQYARKNNDWVEVNGLTDTERTNLTDAYSHSQTEGNPHGTTIGGITGLRSELTDIENGIGNLESAVDAMYNSEVAGTTDEISVSSSTSGKVKTFIVSLANAIKTKIDAAYEHISDSVKHITATERTNWNEAYSHSQVEGNPHDTTIGEIAGLRSELTGIESDLAAVVELIPSEATPSNQLADKAFVNSSITSNTATFRGTSEAGLTEEQFLAWANGLAKVNDDYVFWNTTDEYDNVVYKRYKYNGSSWIYEYSLNNSSFTAVQWAAINSGITESDARDIGYNTAARHTHSNKNLLDTYTQSNANLADAVSKKHSHSNKTVLDNTTASFTTSYKNKLDGIESGAQVNPTVDSALSGTSTNPVQNKVVTSALGETAPTNHASADTTYGVGDETNYGHVKVDSALSESSTNPVQNKTVKSALDKKQEALDRQYAYSDKGSGTKVPRISTNNLGQVISVTEVPIEFPSSSGMNTDATNATKAAIRNMYSKIDAGTTIGDGEYFATTSSSNQFKYTMSKLKSYVLNGAAKSVQDTGDSSKNINVRWKDSSVGSAFKHFACFRTKDGGDSNTSATICDIPITEARKQMLGSSIGDSNTPVRLDSNGVLQPCSMSNYVKKNIENTITTSGGIGLTCQDDVDARIRALETGNSARYIQLDVESDSQGGNVAVYGRNGQSNGSYILSIDASTVNSGGRGVCGLGQSTDTLVRLGTKKLDFSGTFGNETNTIYFM